MVAYGICSAWVEILCLVLFVHGNLKKTLESKQSFDY